VALFLKENLVHAEHFRTEHLVSKLAYLSDIFVKFDTLNLKVHFTWWAMVGFLTSAAKL
jgi:hypothetical protein